MSITLGKIQIDDDWDVYNVEFKQGNVTCRFDRNDDKNFTNHDGGLVHSLNDILIVKLMEVVLGVEELENPEPDTFFIPCSNENPYWVQIITRGSDIDIEVGEPAA